MHGRSCTASANGPEAQSVHAPCQGCKISMKSSLMVSFLDNYQSLSSMVSETISVKINILNIGRSQVCHILVVLHWYVSSL